MWQQFDQGKSINTRGSESGVILRDEEHALGARITLERDGYKPFSITCGIYGWMVHTIFFATESEAQITFDKVKLAIEKILDLIPFVDDPDVTAKSEVVSDAISDFVSQF
jgi:hypothetical protein